ncbi:MAG: dihydrofolate reductase family protein [Acholeplasmataceae bacterium]
MRKIKLYIAMTIDGYIASLDGHIDFLNDYGKDGLDYGYAKFLETIGTVILGRKTYDQVIGFSSNYPYEKQTSYVLTTSKNNPKINHIIFKNNIDDIISDIKDKQGKDIFLVGGAKTIKIMMDKNLIDEIHLSIIPKTLGEGIPCFLKHQNLSTYQVLDTNTYKDGIVQIIYRKI